MGLRTRVCELFDIEVPIVLAGMGGAATPELAAAVSNAGGLGVIGAAACAPRRLRHWIQRTRELTDRPFGVDTIHPSSGRPGVDTIHPSSGRPGVDTIHPSPGRPGGEPKGPGPPEKLAEHRAFARAFMQREELAIPSQEAMARHAGIEPEDLEGPPFFSRSFFEAQMQVIVDERVPVYAAGLGLPEVWTRRLHAVGSRVIAVVGSVEHVARVRAAGADAIVAQGHDGGGHNAPVGTLALIPQVVDAAGGVPVLGAGGIADGRGVAAALMLGAEGAWIGTAFLATPEAGIPDFQKQALLESDASGTVVSRCMTGRPVRLLRGKWASAFDASGLEPLPMLFQSLVASPVMTAAAEAERVDVDPGIAGQGVGLVRELRPAALVLRDLVEGAEAALHRTGALAKR